MKKSFLELKDGRLAVSGRKPFTGRKYISKEETLDFIGYLMKKEDVIIEERTERRGLLSGYLFDYAPLERETLAAIKRAESAEAAYNVLAFEKAKLNCRRKEFPISSGWMEEDLTEFVISLGFDGADAGDITLCVENRTFKGSKWMKDKRLPDDFKIWARACPCFLRSRSYLPDLFGNEYEIFRGRRENKAADDEKKQDEQ